MRMQILNWLKSTGQIDLVELLTEPTPQYDIVDYFESLGFKRAEVNDVWTEFDDVVKYSTTHLGKGVAFQRIKKTSQGEPGRF